MDDGQKTPHGHPDFNSYVKILRVLVFITDGQTEKIIRCGLGRPTARELEELYVQNQCCFVFQTDGWTDRQMEMLILIPTFKIYMFSYYRWTNRRTDGQRHNPVWAG